jgi:hypothetical protein
MRNSELRSRCGEQRLSRILEGSADMPDDLAAVATSAFKTNLAKAIKRISAMQSVSICFVADSTGSMSCHLDAVKNHYSELISGVASYGCRVHGIAFVGYKDWCDGDDHFQIKQFSENDGTPQGHAAFCAFMRTITASGGGDEAEDVLGGLDCAVRRVIWPQESGTRIIFHMADAPPHGSQYGSSNDSLPMGHPKDRPVSELFADMKQRQIQYFFGRINSSTALMEKVFSEAYGMPVDKWSVDSADAGRVISNLTSIVGQSVSRSVSAVHCRENPASQTRQLVMDAAIPLWEGIQQQKCDLIEMSEPSCVDDITGYKKLRQKVTVASIKISERPFAKGGVRYAYHALALYEDGTSEHVVVKDYICSADDQAGKNPFMVDCEAQVICEYLAKLFNEKLSKTSPPSLSAGERPLKPLKLQFLTPKVMRVGQRWMSFEKFRTGAMTKLNSNYGHVEADASFRQEVELAQAFSHFTYDITRGYLLVCDIQGFRQQHRGQSYLMLTDPAIHCPLVASHRGVPRFGGTNLQDNGIEAFFRTYKENRYTEALALHPPAFALTQRLSHDAVDP